MKFTFAQTFMLDLNQTQSLQLIKVSIFLEPSELTLHKISLLLCYFSVISVFLNMNKQSFHARSNIKAPVN